MTTDDQVSNKCGAHTKAGQPCRATATPSGFCFAHAPELKDKREQARRRGGSNSARRVRFAAARPPILDHVMDIVIAAMRDVSGGGLDHRRAQAVAALAAAAVRTYECGSLEERLHHLEDDGDDAQ
jgi:hypothetical protein